MTRLMAADAVTGVNADGSVGVSIDGGQELLRRDVRHPLPGGDDPTMFGTSIGVVADGDAVYGHYGTPDGGIPARWTCTD